MIILGIETSCDETAAAVLEQKDGRIQILSNIIGTSAQMQEKYGGVIPEQAAREQIKSIIPVIQEALRQAFPDVIPAQAGIHNIDAIAVTYGPGLIGSLLVGVETAKALALIWNKPLIPVNHLLGHFYANWIEEGSTNSPNSYSLSEAQRSRSVPTFPCIGLLVSGGHSDLVRFQKHGKFEYLGGTRDDAAGECFDKCARLIGYPYPGGPKISKIGEKGDPNSYKLPRPLHDSKDYDFSFSGLKTAFANLVTQHFKVISFNPKNADAHWKHIVSGNNLEAEERKLADLCASIEQAIVDSLVKKTISAVKECRVEQLIVAGGVAANQKLAQTLKDACEKLGVKLHIPPPELCTDNAAMIASRGFFEKAIDPLKLQANPGLGL